MFSNSIHWTVKPTTLLLSILMGFLTLCNNAYAIGTPHPGTKYYTDAELKQLATEIGIIPKDADKSYFDEQKSQGNSVILWILFDRATKISTIDKLKQMYLDNSGVVIKKPSANDVDEMNGVLYNSFNGDEVFSDMKKGIGVIFKTIAYQEGDYDEGSGRSKVEILKEYLGSAIFERYRLESPGKVQELIEMDKEAK